MFESALASQIDKFIVGIAALLLLLAFAGCKGDCIAPIAGGLSSLIGSIFLLIFTCLSQLFHYLSSRSLSQIVAKQKLADRRQGQSGQMQASKQTGSSPVQSQAKHSRLNRRRNSNV